MVFSLTFELEYVKSILYRPILRFPFFEIIWLCPKTIREYGLRQVKYTGGVKFGRIEKRKFDKIMFCDRILSRDKLC